jgi:hypothetical protein
LEWPTAASSQFILFTPFLESYFPSTTFSPLGTEKSLANKGAAALVGSDV